MDEIAEIKIFITKQGNTMNQELIQQVMSFDKGVEYKGRIVATLFGPNYRDTVSGTNEGDIYWCSLDKELLLKINQEVFNDKATIMQWKEDEPHWILFIELNKITQ